jgi:hypothetical protein
MAMSEARLAAGAPLTVDVDIGMGDSVGLETGADDPEVGTRFNRFLSFGAHFATRILTFSTSFLGRTHLLLGEFG